MPNEPSERRNLTYTLQWVQLAVLIIAAISFTADLGRADQRLVNTEESLRELRSIVQDLLRSQITSVSNDSVMTEQISGLNNRLTRLENQ